MRWVRHVVHLEEKRNIFRILFRKPEGKRTHVRFMHRWKNTIKMDSKEIRWEFVDWIHLAQNKD
jgi:hypothetical protein